jgi:hypothetical protein
MISTGQEGEGEGMLTDRIHSQRFWIRSSCLRLLLEPMGGCLRLRFPCLSSMDADRLARGRLLMGRGMGTEMTVVVLLHREAGNTPALRLVGMAPTMAAEVEVEASMAPRNNMVGLARSATATMQAVPEVGLEVEADRVILKEEATTVEMQVLEEVVVVDLRIIEAAMTLGMGMDMGGVEAG